MKMCGLTEDELLDIREKLNNENLELKDLIEFIDRDKTQLFAEQQRKIKWFEFKVKAIKEATEI